MSAVRASIGGLWVVLGLATNGLLVEVAALALVTLDQLLPLAVAGLQVGGDRRNLIRLCCSCGIGTPCFEAPLDWGGVAAVRVQYQCAPSVHLSSSHLADALIMGAVVATNGRLGVVLGLAPNGLLFEVAPLAIVALHQ